MDFCHPFTRRLVLDGKYKMATYGLGDYMLSKRPYRGSIGSYKVLDVRHMADGPGNGPEVYSELIGLGCKYLERHKKLVVCCLAGISRSNAIAMGILMRKFGYEYYDALNLVQSSVPNCRIADSHLDALKALFGPRGIMMSPTGLVQ